MARKPADPLPPQVAAALVLLAACGLPARWAGGWTGRVRDALRNDRPNAADVERIERSYYERICGGPAPRPFDAGVLALVVPDAREYVLKPNFSTLHRGARWTTNRHGRRDRDRSPAKPPGVLRIALVGDSIGAGWGVEDEQVLTRLLEEAYRCRGAAVEVLNFATPGHAPGQRWEDFSKSGWAFEPDLVLFQGSTADPHWDERRLRAFTLRGLGADSHVYGEWVRSLGLGAGLSPEEAKERLRPYRDVILPGVHRLIAADCRSRGVPVVGLIVPRVGKPATAEERRRLADSASAAGFAAWFDLTDAFEGLDPGSFAIAPDDFHPGAEGHALLARRVEERLNASGLLKFEGNQGGEPR